MSLHCPYCCEPGHNIIMCNNPDIIHIYENIKAIFERIYNLQINQQMNKISFIRTIRQRFNSASLKAVGVKYLSLLYSSNKTIITIELWNNFSSLRFVSQQNMVSQLPNIPDIIPDFAQDLSVEQPEEDLGWHIDRQPQLHHFEVNTLLRMFEFDMPPHPPPLVRSRYTGGNRIMVPNQYNPTNDEFIEFAPQNLNSLFQRTLIPQIKKYNILPTLVCSKTSEELEKCEDCPICYELLKLADTVTINCEHKFCGTCIKETLNLHNNIYTKPSCALCRTEMKTFVMTNQDVYNLVAEHCIL